MFKLRNPKDYTQDVGLSPTITTPQPLPREEHTETFDIKRFSKGKCLGEDIITICSVCKKIKDQVSGEWVEITPPTDMNLCFSHSYCMPCVKELHPEIYDNVLQRSTEKVIG